VTIRTIGVAITVPEPYGGSLQRVREGYGDELAASIPTHITLLPPTEVDAGDMDDIEKHLRTIAESLPSFEIRLRGTGSFRPVSPVVFVSVVVGLGDCERLEALVRTGPLGRELTFPYHPHVTIAHDIPADDLQWAFDEMAGYDVRFEVWGFSLYELGRDGVWRPQRDFPLGLALPGPHVS